MRKLSFARDPGRMLLYLLPSLLPSKSKVTSSRAEGTRPPRCKQACTYIIRFLETSALVKARVAQTHYLVPKLNIEL